MKTLTEENDALRTILRRILERWEREGTAKASGLAVMGGEEKPDAPDAASQHDPTGKEPVFITTTVVLGPETGHAVPSSAKANASPSSLPPSVSGEEFLEKTVVLDVAKGTGISAESGGPGQGSAATLRPEAGTDDLEKTTILRASGTPAPAGSRDRPVPTPGEKGSGMVAGEAAGGDAPVPEEDFLDKTVVLRDGKIPPGRKR